jgi:magnesium-transporting ATPase (P-type)
MSMFSFLCITTLALERYTMLKFPIKHRRWSTKSVLVAIVFAIILFSVIGALSPLFYSLPVRYHGKLHICIFDVRGATTRETMKRVLVQLVTLVFLLFVLVYCSAAVVVIIWKRRSFLSQITPQDSTNSSAVTIECTLKEKCREIRSTVHILSVMLVILACCLPFIIIYVCDIAGYYLSERSSITSIFIFFCKSALNPLTNAFLHSRLRQYLLNILCCRKQSP